MINITIHQRLIISCILFLIIGSFAAKEYPTILFPDTFDLDKKDLHELEFAIVNTTRHSSFLILMDPTENNIIYVLRNGTQRGDTSVWNTFDYMLKECFCGRNYLMIAFNKSKISHAKKAKVKYSKNPCPILTKEMREYIDDHTGDQVTYRSPWLAPDIVPDSTVAWVRTGWIDLPTAPSDHYETTSNTIVQNMRIVRKIQSSTKSPSNSELISLEQFKEKNIRIQYSLNKYDGIHLIAVSPNGGVDAVIITISNPSLEKAGILDIPIGWINTYFPVESAIGLIAIQGQVYSKVLWLKP